MFKSKKGYITLYVILGLVIAMLLTVTILSVVNNFLDEDLFNSIYAARELGTTIDATNSIPSNFDVTYKFPYTEDNLLAGINNNKVILYKGEYGNAGRGLPLATYYFTTPSNLIIRYTTKNIFVNGYTINKYNNILDLTGATHLFNDNELSVLDEFKEGKFLYYQFEDDDLVAIETGFHQLLKPKTLTEKETAKILFIVKFSDKDVTKITYSLSNQHYLKIIADSMNENLINAKSNGVAVLNPLKVTFAKDYVDSYGSNVILLEINSKAYKSIDKNNKGFLGNVLSNPFNALIKS